MDFKKALETHTAIEASAGTGKTYSIENIIIAAIKENIPIEKIAVITFTEKAAMELQERIRLEITKQCNSKNEFTEIFQKAKEDFPFATIGTIHQFCRVILRANSFVSGLSPKFEETKEEWKEIESVFSIFKGKLDLNKKEEVIELIQSIGVSLFQNFIIESAILFQGKSWSLPELDKRTLQEDLEKIIGMKSAVLSEKKSANYIQELKEVFELDSIEKLANNFQKFESTFFTKEGKIKKVSKDFLLSKLSITETDYENLLFSFKSSLEYLNSFQNLRILCKLSNEFILEVKKYFLENDKLTTSEIILLTRDLIQNNEEVLKKVQSDYQYIIVDEFQDTSPIQADLFTTILGGKEKGLIFVGDPKQSIYGFLNSDIESYKNTIEIFQHNKEVLSETRRSTTQLTEVFNRIFSFLLEGMYSNVKSERDDRDTYEYSNNLTPLILLGLDENNIPRSRNESGEDLKTEEIRKLSSIEISNLIRFMIDQEVEIYDKELKKTRKITYSDITILSEKRTNFSYLEEEFSKSGIPSSIYKNEKFYESSLIQSISYLLHSIENPNDSLSLIKALKSELFLVSDESLFHLSENEEVSYLSKATDKSIQEIFLILSKLHYKKNIQSASLTLADALNEFKILEKVSLGFYGNRNITDINHLHEILDSYQTEENLSYGEVVRRLKKNISESTKQNVKISSDKNSGESSVSVMTIHASKGLEFPVVILFDLTAKPKPEIKNSFLIPNDKLYLKEPIVTEVKIKSEISLSTPSIEEKLKIKREKEKDEKKRLLYVAFTRARDYLVLPLYHVSKGSSGSLREVLNIDNQIQSFIQDSLGHNFQSSQFAISKSSVKKENPKVKSSNLDKIPFFDSEKLLKEMEKLEIESYSSLHRKDSRTIEKKIEEETEEEILTKSEEENRSKSRHLLYGTKDIGKKFGSLSHLILEEYSLDKFQSEKIIENELTSLIDYHYPRSGIIEEVNYSKSDLFEICFSALTKLHLINPNPETYAKFSEWKNLWREREFFHYIGKKNKTEDSFFYGIGDGIFTYNSKYYILDWKSNLLKDYSEPTLFKVVNESYFYQYHIYSLNLLKNLEYFYKESIEKFWDENFGGMVFIFIRETENKKGNFSVKPSYKELMDFQDKILSNEL
ncbi:MAG: UvrD-helicase domain-containing protein [Leptospiraceae bacterium]|nr:UvrD-helicase domain-containing protein [Leptospiraceae bacterium]MCK6380782.1 UvrD-helicase domain-containing protein [Leptospiraceae bacterium]